MKKLLLILLTCTFAFSLNVKYVFAYPAAVAVITNYYKDSLAGRITIHRANGKPDSTEEYLYPNDRITGDIAAVKFKFSANAKSNLEGNEYVIVYEPPSFLGGLADSAINAFSRFWTPNEEELKPHVTMGIVKATDLTPQPGYNPTLLSNQKIIFSWWDSDKKNFLITDEKGKKVFEQKIDGLTSIELDASKLKLQAGKKYFWNVDDELNGYTLTLLDKKTEAEILSALAKIDSENISESDRLLKKVSYLQLVSDTFPEKINLYWLSAQLLLNFNPADNNDDLCKDIFLKRCITKFEDNKQ